MSRKHLLWGLVPAAAALLAACADTATAPDADAPDAPSADLVVRTLAWFGYAPSGLDQPSLDGTRSYANWGFVATDPDPNSTVVSSGINALRSNNQVAIVSLGLLLWCPRPGEPWNDGGKLCPNRLERWRVWKEANAAALNSGSVLAFTVRDEPFHHEVDIDSLEAASAMVKRDFPNAKIIVIEAAIKAASSDPNSYFNQNAWRLTTVDWVGVDIYGIHPGSNGTLDAAVTNMKAKFRSKPFVYVADGWSGGIGATPGVMQEWYNKALADPTAVLLAVFGWDDSKNFSSAVLAEHISVGRAITGRTRTRLYQPTGAFEGIDAQGYAVGWACDPDGAWNEAVWVDFYSNGQYLGSGKTDEPDSGAYLSQCRSGNRHRFRVWVNGRTNVTAVVRDLDAGSVSLPGPSTSVAWVQPAGVTWGTPNTLTVAGYASGGSGGVQLTWRDATAGGGWNVEGWAPPPSGGTWSNTLPSSNYCHDYEVYSTYNGVTSSVFTYRGLTSGHCEEETRMIWIQPQSRAGIGPPGSLVVAGSASGAPAGTGVTMFWRDVTAGQGWWTQVAYAAPTDANGIWLNAIENANPYHQYEVFVRYDVVESAACTYAGANDITWC